MSSSFSSHSPLKKNPLRVCSFESRRSVEMKGLIEKQGGIATVAPSMREVPLEENKAAFLFAEELLADKIDIVIFMTGVGATALFDAVATRYDLPEILVALNKIMIGVRGPKPAALLRKKGLSVDFKAEEPNTWREILTTIDTGIDVAEKKIAIQEYGEPTPLFYSALEERGATVLPVPVYRWEFPTDIEPMSQAIDKTIAGEFDVIVWTSANQLTNVLQVAKMKGVQADWLTAAKQCCIASIGPTASARIKSAGLQVDIEASPPKMGHLIKSIFDK